MKNKLLTCGFILLATGGALGIISCATALVDPLYFPASLLVSSFIFIAGGFIVLVIDGNNDLKRQRKIDEDLGLLLITFEKLQKKNTLNNILANMLFPEVQETTGSGLDGNL